MEKIILLLIISQFFISQTKAQNRQVISSAGNTSTVQGIRITQTIGQDVSFTQNRSTTQYFAQGFQQPINRSSVSVKSTEPLFVYPNPNNGNFIVDDIEEQTVKLLQMYDAKGAEISFNYELLQNKIRCTIEDDFSGIYLLRIIFRDGQERSVKVIKSDI